MKCKRYIVVVGMNDSVSLKQEKDEASIIQIVNECCIKYKCPFSLNILNGGYINKQGKYINEKSVGISIINPKNSKVVDKIAKDLCYLLNQECVSVTIDEVERYNIKKN